MRGEGQCNVDVAVRRILAHGPDVVCLAAVDGGKGVVASDADVWAVDLLKASAICVRMMRRERQANRCRAEDEALHGEPPTWSRRRAAPSAPRSSCRRCTRDNR